MKYYVCISEIAAITIKSPFSYYRFDKPPSALGYA